MHDWIVKLSGNDGDIKELADCLVDPSVSISKAATNDAYILSSPDFRKLEDAEKVVERACELITSILGMSHLYGIDCMNIDIESVYKQYSDGSGESTQLFNGKVRIINRSADQFSISDVELSDKSVSSALRILSKGDLNWINIYKLWEIVIDDVGSNSPYDRGWVSKKEIRNLKHTANSMSAVGDFARHGPMPNDPPAIPMAIEDARTIIKSIIKEWMNAKQIKNII